MRIRICVAFIWLTLVQGKITLSEWRKRAEWRSWKPKTDSDTVRRAATIWWGNVMSRTARDGCAVYPVKRKHLTKEACFLALLFRYPGALHWRNRWENGLPFGARKPSVKDHKNGALLSLMSFRQLSSSFLFFFFSRLRIVQNDGVLQTPV